MGKTYWHLVFWTPPLRSHDFFSPFVLFACGTMDMMFSDPFFCTMDMMNIFWSFVSIKCRPRGHLFSPFPPMWLWCDGSKYKEPICFSRFLRFCLVLMCWYRISPITKTDIRDLCGAFHLNIRDRIAQWESSTLESYASIPFSVDYARFQSGLLPSDCLFSNLPMVRWTWCPCFKCPLPWWLSTPFFFFLGS